MRDFAPSRQNAMIWPSVCAKPHRIEATTKPAIEMRRTLSRPTLAVRKPESGGAIAAATMLGGQCPVGLIRRGGNAALYVGQRDIGDRRIQRLQGDEVAVWKARCPGTAFAADDCHC